MLVLGRPVVAFIPPLTSTTPSLKARAAVATSTSCTSRQRRLSLSARRPSTPHRSQLLSNGHIGEYDRDEPLRGPLGNKDKPYPKPEFYPGKLKAVVDQYVVGQERAKKTICSTIFNHYQNLRRRDYLDVQAQKERERLTRQMKAAQEEAFKTYNEYHEGGISEVRPDFMPEMVVVPDAGKFLVREKETPSVKIDKSNLLLIGPTGVGKTYILETLSKKLRVPFTISDCNSFTQAGYIGQDVETCIERLLIEANYDISATERGIVVLDEFDKIARRETMNGRDVGGEGVQQALLKLVEGTKVTINIKDNKSSRNQPPPPSSSSSSSSGFNPLGSNINNSQPGSSPPPHPGKMEQYTIDTSNILFVFCGAFVGLDKHVIRRVAKPSMGFGSELRGPVTASGSKHVLPDEMYAHLPHQPVSGSRGADGSGSSQFTPLDLTTPADLQAFGFIPELIGRVHNVCALSPLSLSDLFRILTEPRNSLVAQYCELFLTYPSRLAFTNKALRAVAGRAAASETGARGLKMEMERVLAGPMFQAPNDYVLITEASVLGKDLPLYWGRDGRFEWERIKAEEDEEVVNAEPMEKTLGHLRKQYDVVDRQAGASSA